MIPDLEPVDEVRRPHQDGRLERGAAALVLHRVSTVVLPVVIEPRLPLDHVTSVMKSLMTVSDLLMSSTFAAGR